MMENLCAYQYSCKSHYVYAINNWLLELIHELYNNINVYLQGIKKIKEKIKMKKSCNKKLEFQ
mgnify:CR=1 FL=1